ncbi:TetR/AcrR family transcriptional regulator [Pseudomonas viridiflava]|uniref:TetR/AcrR family transcriptional regulator n=1 Tax=Pseudomonas viridiflava TaxID=33069 RepID=UPI000F04B233|nr:helix-turn-helix domain-containing protein [Pseudomonas viridiflava]
MQIERKDSIHNRAELLAAAESAVAVHGVDVAFNLIAKLAGVGQGTLYRHFPNRDALIQALLERSMDNLECFAAQQTDHDAMFRVLDSTQVRSRSTSRLPPAAASSIRTTSAL